MHLASVALCVNLHHMFQLLSLGCCRETGRQLEQLGNDFDLASVWACEFLPNHNKLNIVMAEGSASLQLMVYDKEDRNSWAGKKLMLRGAAHVGSHITRLQRMRMKVPNDKYNR